jgi:hypothetical protein
MLGFSKEAWRSEFPLQEEISRLKSWWQKQFNHIQSEHASPSKAFHFSSKSKRLLLG